MSHLRKLVAALRSFFLGQLPEQTITSTKNLKAAGNFNRVSWRRLAAEITQLPVVRQLGLRISANDIEQLATIQQIADLMLSRAQSEAAGRLRPILKSRMRHPATTAKRSAGGSGLTVRLGPGASLSDGDAPQLAQLPASKTLTLDGDHLVVRFGRAPGDEDISQAAAEISVAATILPDGLDFPMDEPQSEVDDRPSEIRATHPDSSRPH